MSIAAKYHGEDGTMNTDGTTIESEHIQVFKVWIRMQARAIIKAHPKPVHLEEGYIDIEIDIASFTRSETLQIAEALTKAANALPQSE